MRKGLILWWIPAMPRFRRGENELVMPSLTHFYVHRGQRVSVRGFVCERGQMRKASHTGHGMIVIAHLQGVSIWAHKCQFLQKKIVKCSLPLFKTALFEDIYYFVLCSLTSPTISLHNRQLKTSRKWHLLNLCTCLSLQTWSTICWLLFFKPDAGQAHFICHCCYTHDQI